MGDNRKTGRPWKRRLVALAVAAVVAAGLAELLLALLAVGFPRPYIPDDHIGTRLQPGFTGWFGKEGGAHVRVNSRGFRDQEHEPEKPDDCFRIVVLGDSYVEAVQVEVDETFWKIVESKLSSRAAVTRIEVLAFGISGFGTTQELLTFQHYARSFAPDVVILAMTLSNDVRNNSIDLEPVRARPFFELIDGELVADRSFRQDPAFLNAQQTGTKFKTSLINASRVIQVAAEAKHRWTQGRRQTTVEQGLDDSLFQPPAAHEWVAAWETTEALVVKLRDDVVAADAELVVATVTTGIQVHPDSRVYDDYCHRMGIKDLSYPADRVASLCRQHGIPVLKLAAPMRQHARSHQVWLHGFANTELGTGHWNSEGHAVAGHLIAEFLIERGLVPASAETNFN